MDRKKFLSIKRCLYIAYHSSPCLFIVNIVSTLALGIFSGISIYSITVLVNGIQAAIVEGGGKCILQLEVLALELGGSSTFGRLWE